MTRVNVSLSKIILFISFSLFSLINKAQNTITICNGDSALIYNNWVTQNGVYTDGINSTILIVNPTSTSAVVDTACGEYNWQGIIFNTSGNYTDTLTGYNGCDSIVNLALTIFEDSSVTYITACDSVQWNGVYYYNDTNVTNTGFLTINSFGSSSTPSNSKEGNIWYFGENAGIDFNSGVPISLNDGQLNTLEGCASIADYNGDLLFYTDGSLVYNKNHTIMPNGTGLFGNNSSSQSAIIVKKPASTSIYYIFTVGAAAAIEGHFVDVRDWK